MTADIPPTDASKDELAQAVKVNVFAMFRTMKELLGGEMPDY